MPYYAFSETARVMISDEEESLLKQMRLKTKVSSIPSKYQSVIDGLLKKKIIAFKVDDETNVAYYNKTWFKSNNKGKKK